MCGRFSFAITEKFIEEHYGFSLPDYTPRYNCAPAQMLAVVTDHQPGGFSFLRWGFVPSWAKEISAGSTMINAKAETVSTKPAFRKSLLTKRCLVPADSFYEWSQGSSKIPYRILLKNKPVFSMAGIWSEWQSPENIIISSFAIITTEANAMVGNIHNRMPVIFDNINTERSWLQNNSVEELLSLLQPLDAEKMEMYQVSEKLNFPRNDFPGLHNHAETPGLF